MSLEVKIYKDLFEKEVPKSYNSCVYEVYIDGASRGNPGPAGTGIIICKDNTTIKNISRFIGTATNNVAEYMALIFALQELLKFKAKNIVINTDSELLANQITKKFKVKNQALKKLNLEILRLFSLFNNVQINKIARNENRGADKLAVKAVKEQVKMATPTQNRGGGKSELRRET